jgi:hypothetical protein
VTKLAIFYEDSRMAGSSRYPLHELVCACLADALDQPYDAIKAIGRAIPKNGDSKLLKACQIEVPNMREPMIVALFDADKMHQLLRQPGNTELETLHEQLDAKIAQPRVETFLVEKNTESIVAAAADCRDQPRPGKNHLQRDKLLESAVWDSREQRDCIRRKVPSFARFIDALAPKVAPLLAS